MAGPKPHIIARCAICNVLEMTAEELDLDQIEERLVGKGWAFLKFSYKLCPICNPSSTPIGALNDKQQ